jgi:hypothetical protein
VQAVTTAKAGLQQASNSLPALEAKVALISEKLQAMQGALAQVKTAVEGAPVEEPMKQELDQAGQQILASLTKAQEQASAELKAGREQVTSAQAALTTALAQQEQAARKLRETGRVGTVLWNAANNIPATSRVTAQLGLSIMAEEAPFQVRTNLQRIEVRPGQQLLLTTQLSRRTGFEEAVKLTVQGLPKEANIDMEAGEIAKGQAEKTLKVFVKPNSPAGSVFTAWLASEGEVNYRRNPEKAARLQQALEAAQQQVAKLKTQMEEAEKAKTAAEAALKETSLQVQTANAAVTQQQQNLETGRKELVALGTEMAQAQQLAKKAETLVAASRAASAAFEKSVLDAIPTVAAATAALEASSQLLQSSPASPELKQRHEAARQAVDTATKLVDELKKQAGTAASDLASTEQQHKQLAESLAAITKKHEERQSGLKEIQSTLDKALAVAQEKVAAEVAAKSALEVAVQGVQKVTTELAAATKAEQDAAKVAADAAKAAEAKKLKFTPPSEPVIFIVKPAPVEVKPEVPNAGTLKAGESIPVKVKVVRKDGFTGPVKVSLGDVPTGRGLTAEEVTIPAGTDEAVLSVVVSPDAAEGDVPNVVVRTHSEFDGEAIVDAPVALKIAK